MTMTTKSDLRRWLIYKTAHGLPVEQWSELRNTHGPGVEIVLSNGTSSGDHHKLLEVGDRTHIYEEMRVPEAAHPDRPNGNTHWRKSAWVVASVEVYSPDIPIGMEFDEIVVYTCDYAPLPDEENPWVLKAPPVDLRHYLSESDESIELMGITREKLKAMCLERYGTTTLPQSSAQTVGAGI
jgi:hypothetical protein